MTSVASGGIIDVWLTANQWDVVLEALSQRRTAKAKTVSDRIFATLTDSPAYCRHFDEKFARLGEHSDGNAYRSGS